MQTKTFTGKEKAGIDQQVWEWKVGNPKIKVLGVYPIERLPLELNPIRRFSKITATDLFSMRVDFEEIRVGEALAQKGPRAERASLGRNVPAGEPGTAGKYLSRSDNST